MIKRIFNNKLKNGFYILISGIVLSIIYIGLLIKYANETYDPITKEFNNTNAITAIMFIGFMGFILFIYGLVNIIINKDNK